VELAESHGLGPLLYRRLKESGVQAGVPADSWDRLRLVYFVNAERNTRLFRQLRPVLQCCSDADIPVIVLKGAYLAEGVYDNVALRPMVDVDLLVARADLPRAQARLLGMGYGPQKREDIDARCRRSSELTPFVGLGSSVDLHWSIASPTSPLRVDIGGLWKRAQPATTAGVQVLALSPEDLLLHLCLHTSYEHGLGEGLRQFCDIAATIRHFGELDWPQFVDRSRDWGAGRYVGLALRLAQSMLGAEVPEDVIERLVPGGIDARILETARESVLARASYVRWLPFFDAFGARSFRDKAKRSWQRVFLSRAEMGAKYPASRGRSHLWPYYLLRVRDVILAYWAHIFRRARLMLRTHGRDRAADLGKWLGSGKP